MHRDRTKSCNDIKSSGESRGGFSLDKIKRNIINKFESFISYFKAEPSTRPPSPKQSSVDQLRAQYNTVDHRVQKSSFQESDLSHCCRPNYQSLVSETKPALSLEKGAENQRSKSRIKIFDAMQDSTKNSRAIIQSFSLDKGQVSHQSNKHSIFSQAADTQAASGNGNPSGVYNQTGKISTIKVSSLFLNPCPNGTTEA